MHDLYAAKQTAKKLSVTQKQPAQYVQAALSLCLHTEKCAATNINKQKNAPAIAEAFGKLLHNKYGYETLKFRGSEEIKTKLQHECINRIIYVEIIYDNQY